MRTDIKSRLKDKLYYFLWRTTHRRSRKFISWWQNYHLRELLAYTQATIPMYEKLWKANGINIHEIESTNELSTLPIVEKKSFLNYRTEEYTHIVENGSYSWTSTSGSTGEPFRAVKPQYGPAGIMPPYVDDHYWRFLTWQGQSIHKLKTKGKVLDIREKNLPWIQSSRPKTWELVTLRQLLEDPQAAVQLLTRTEDSFSAISGYNSVLVEVARLLAERDAYANIPYALGSGDMLSDEQRSLVETRLRCKLFNQYSSEELWVIGTECTEHNGFHIYSESYIVEIVDENGQVVPEGTEGRVVITNLYNTAMPFIRYASGDRGMLMHEECACGLQTPRLILKGREGFFIDLGVRKVHYVELLSVMNLFSREVLQYQFVKTSPEILEIHMVPSAGVVVDALEQRVAMAVRTFIGTELSIVPRTVNQLKRTERGKRRLYVDEVELR